MSYWGVSEGKRISVVSPLRSTCCILSILSDAHRPNIVGSDRRRLDVKPYQYKSGSDESANSEHRRARYQIYYRDDLSRLGRSLSQLNLGLEQDPTRCRRDDLFDRSLVGAAFNPPTLLVGLDQRLHISIRNSVPITALHPINKNTPELDTCQPVGPKPSFQS